MGRYETPTIWVTPNKNSQVVCSAVRLATGFPMRNVWDAYSGDPGPSIVYGLLRGCSEIMQRCRAAGSDFWHIDHGYIGRSEYDHYDGYYRISKNSTFAQWEDPAVKERSMPGEYVVVCPPTVPVAAYYGASIREWTDATVAELKRVHGVKVRVRSKNTTSMLEADIDGARAVVAYNSNLAVDLARDGLPASQLFGPLQKITMQSALLGAVPDRDALEVFLRAHQWRLSEITEGIFQ